MFVSVHLTSAHYMHICPFAGFLFRWELALLLICFCSATGASFCYLLSYLAGRPIVLKYLPDRTKSWQEKVRDTTVYSALYELFCIGCIINHNFSSFVSIGMCMFVFT